MTTTIDLATSNPSLDELLALAAGGTEVHLVHGATPLAILSPAEKPAAAGGQRVPDLFPGAAWLSDDFNAPLTEEFLTGKDS